jgi:hypothetical protein
MVPTHIIQLEKMPLTHNDKLDTSNLPEPSSTDRADERNYEEPTGDLQKSLCGIFGELLGHEKIGTRDNFFELGGQSMLVLRALGLMHKRLNLDVKVPQFYDHPTVKQLSQFIESRSTGKA